MRIYGNRAIKTLPGGLTRPTTSRVREAVFHIWHGDIEGCRWLDLCGGSGSMGAEALCRGAAVVIGIDQSSRACAVMRENWQRLATEAQTWRVLRGDVVRRSASLKAMVFDRIYFDPPYGAGLYAGMLGAIATQQLLHPDGELAVEHAPDVTLPVTAGLRRQRAKNYGNSTVTFYRVENSERLAGSVDLPVKLTHRDFPRDPEQ